MENKILFIAKKYFMSVTATAVQSHIDFRGVIPGNEGSGFSILNKVQSRYILIEMNELFMPMNGVQRSEIEQECQLVIKFIKTEL
jgi:hypothetical protein